jgi:hypothetical protein
MEKEELKDELRELLTENCESCCLDDEDDLERVVDTLAEHFDQRVKGDSDHDRRTPTF